VERITVTIKNGNVKIETSGFSGSACQDATRRLSKVLGRSVKDEATAEMYAPVVTNEPEIGR